MATSAPAGQVLVVGGGTVGTVLALELARLGVASVVLERAPAPAPRPHVHSLGRQGLALLERLDIRLAVLPGASVEWRRHLDGPPIPAAADGSDARWISATELGDRLRDSARRHPLIDLREGWTFTDLRIDAGAVVATALSDGVRAQIDAQFLVGCDGARSTVRRCLGIPMAQLKSADQYCSVAFRSTDPRLNAEFGPATIVVGRSVLASTDEPGTWVGHLPIRPDEPIATDPVALLRGQLGPGFALSQVLGVAQWEDSLAVAEAYGRGPAYLAGESAHRFHPISDALDTSVGDAVDLGGRLADALGGGGLLADYESQRRPAALRERKSLAGTWARRRQFARLVDADASAETLISYLSADPDPVNT